MSKQARRICVVSGSRADYGLLLPVLRAIQTEPSLHLSLAVTGSHLETHLGHTVDAILADGFEIDAAVPLGLNSDDPVTITRALGSAVSGFATALARLQPDMLLVLGDRYEIFAAVQAALIARIPVCHIAGGDVTQGAFDDAIRHAITKLSHLHCATTDQAAQRLRQLGEDDAHIFITGSPGIDQLLATPRLDAKTLSDRLGMTLRPRNLAITFHPATLDCDDAVDQVQQLLGALAALGDGVGLIFTGSNADPQGQAVNQAVRAFVSRHDHAVMHDSLGQQGYYSLLAIADAVVGNSSSGLYEAPSFGTPTVNIGTRQSGRLKAQSVIDCAAQTDAIAAALHQAFSYGRQQTSNPYGDGKATARILDILMRPWDLRQLLAKSFVDRDISV